MARSEAEEVLAAHDITVDSSGATVETRGRNMELGYSFLGQDRWVLLPGPDLRRVQARLYFDGERLGQWEAVTTSTFV